MKRLFLLAALVVVAVPIGWRLANRENARPTPTPTYPSDPAQLAQWVDETLHELIHKGEAGARRWLPLLRSYCEQGCGACCGLTAFALQHLDQWDDAAELAAACQAPECVYAQARELSHHRDQPAQALPLYRQACDAGLPIACSNAGVILAQGRGLAADVPTATALYERACTAGEAIACANLAMLLESRGDATNRPMALYRQACEAGYTRGCERLRSLETKNPAN